MKKALATSHVIGTENKQGVGSSPSFSRAVMLAKTAYIKERKQYIKIKTSVLNSAHQTLMVLKNGLAFQFFFKVLKVL